MISKYVHFDHTEVFTTAQLARSGLILGERRSNKIGDFVLSEASENITAHMIVTDVVRKSFANRTITCASPYTKMTFDPGATIVVNAYAGCIITTRDDDHNSRNGIVKSNDAAISGGTLTIELHAALEGAIGANAEVYIYDANFVEMAAASGMNVHVVGVAPVSVTYATAPYFWRQVSGICAVFDGTTTTPAAAHDGLSAGDGTEGWAIGIGSNETYDDANAFATVLIAATLYDHFCLARIRGVLS
jgi:hypothetical protein